MGRASLGRTARCAPARAARARQEDRSRVHVVAFRRPLEFGTVSPEQCRKRSSRRLDQEAVHGGQQAARGRPRARLPLTGRAAARDRSAASETKEMLWGYLHDRGGASYRRQSASAWNAPLPVRRNHRARRGVPAGPTRPDPRGLSSTYFRDEVGPVSSARLTSSGPANVSLAGETVQGALIGARQTWADQGVPDNAAGSLFASRDNLSVDAVRRDRSWPARPRRNRG